MHKPCPPIIRIDDLVSEIFCINHVSGEEANLEAEHAWLLLEQEKDEIETLHRGKLVY